MQYISWTGQAGISFRQVRFADRTVIKLCFLPLYIPMHPPVGGCCLMDNDFLHKLPQQGRSEFRNPFFRRVQFFPFCRAPAFAAILRIGYKETG